MRSFAFAHQDDRKKTRNDSETAHFGSVVGFRKTLFAGCSKRLSMVVVKSSFSFFHAAWRILCLVMLAKW